MKALEAHQSQLAHTTIADLFKQEENRFNDYSLTFENQILVDFSKNKINQETLKLLRQLAKESALDEAINAMFTGEKLIVQKIELYYIPHFVTVQIHLSM